MLNKCLICSIAVLMLFGCTVFAAPDSIGANDNGNSTGLITLTNPAATSITSFDKNHNISGYAGSGYTVALYKWDGSSYKLMYKDGLPLVWTVGQSGMFVKPVTLPVGKNSLMLRAESGDSNQNIRFDISVLSSNIFNLIKGLSINIFKYN